MKNLLIVLCLFLLALTTTALHAEKVMLVFSGRWVFSMKGDYYENNYDCSFKGTNSCETSYSYKCEDSKEKIAGKITNVIKSHPRCTNYRLDSKDQENSEVYYPVGPLTHDDWLQITKNNPGATKLESWLYIDDIHGCLATAILRPVYTCPSGSVINYDDKGQAYCNKTANKKACVADVVGRDFKGIPLPAPGHVGFVGSNNNVIQVLNDKEVIHTDSSLLEFQHVTSFWGERFGLEVNDDNKMMELGADDADKVVKTGVDQKQFDPEYTFGVFWQAGGYDRALVYDSAEGAWIKQNAFKRAKFRCDTFVNYCYNQGLGLSNNKRLPRSFFITPLSSYRSFLSERKNIIIDHLTSKNLIADLKQEMTDTNYTQIDSKMQAYLNDTTVTRQVKLAFLMKQLNQSKSETNYVYLLDNLAGLKAVEVIPQLIDKYHFETNGKKKSKIISTISESIYTSLEKSENILKAKEMVKEPDVQYVTQAQKFIINILKNENDPYTLHQAIDQSLSTLPMNEENYYLIASAINRMEQLDKNVMTSKLKYTLLLSMAFANEKMQSWLLPKILSSTISAADKIIFSEELKFMMKQLPAENIKEKVKLFIQ